MENRLDLHGVKHENVQPIVDKFLFEAMNKKKDRVYIITGNSDEMKRIVINVVKDYKFLVSESLFSSAELIIDL